MANLIEPSFGGRLDTLRRQLKEAESQISNIPDGEEEETLEEINNLFPPLADEYDRILADAGGQNVLDANEDLETKRKQTREVLRRIRQILEARWGLHFSNTNLAIENGVVENNSNANTVMGGENTRRRKQKGGRKKTRRGKRSIKKRKAKRSRKH